MREFNPFTNMAPGGARESDQLVRNEIETRQKEIDSRRHEIERRVSMAASERSSIETQVLSGENQMSEAAREQARLEHARHGEEIKRAAAQMDGLREEEAWIDQLAQAGREAKREEWKQRDRELNVLASQELDERVTERREIFAEPNHEKSGDEPKFDLESRGQLSREAHEPFSGEKRKDREIGDD